MASLTIERGRPVGSLGQEARRLRRRGTAAGRGCRASRRPSACPRGRSSPTGWACRRCRPGACAGSPGRAGSRGCRGAARPAWPSAPARRPGRLGRDDGAGDRLVRAGDEHQRSATSTPARRGRVRNRMPAEAIGRIPVASGAEQGAPGAQQAVAGQVRLDRLAQRRGRQLARVLGERLVPTCAERRSASSMSRS